MENQSTFELVKPIKDSEIENLDVLIVGAGIGGITIAINLTRLGYRVAIIERNPIGIFRLGESIDWEAPIYLSRLGFSIDKWVAEGKAVYKHGAIATSASQPGIEAQFGFSWIFKLLMGLVGRSKPTIHANRELIDIDLINAAKEAGTKLITGKVTKVETIDDKVTGVILANGERLKAKFYVDASGTARLFRRAFAIGETFIGPRKITIRARFPHKYDNLGTRIRTDDTLHESLWIWDINVSQEVTDIGIVLTEKDFSILHQRFKNLPEIFLYIVKKQPDLEWLVPLITPDVDFWTCAFQDYVCDKSSGENWAAVGESAFMVDGLLSSGFTSALRAGSIVSNILIDALTKNSSILSSKMRHIYHEKASSHIRAINRLLDALWYKGRLREHYSLMLNVFSILFFNFNLNHINTRIVPKTITGVKLLKLLHRTVEAFAPRYNNVLTKIAVRLGKTNPNLVYQKLD
jgi:flavin-dependent dehydrogenase